MNLSLHISTRRLLWTFLLLLKKDNDDNNNSSNNHDYGNNDHCDSPSLHCSWTIVSIIYRLARKFYSSFAFLTSFLNKTAYSIAFTLGITSKAATKFFVTICSTRLTAAKFLIIYFTWVFAALVSIILEHNNQWDHSVMEW